MEFFGSPLILVLAILAMLIGTTLQRVCGAGVGLVVSPAFALLFGPVFGIFAINCISIVSASLNLIPVRKRVDWPRVARLMAAALPGCITGALLVRALPAAGLQMVIGAIVLIAVLLTAYTPNLPNWQSGWVIAIAGFIAGLFNTSAGVAAPALIIYSRLSHWDQDRFAASLQPMFIGMGIVSVASKLLFGASGLDVVPPWWAIALIPALVLAGMGIGTLLRRRISTATAQKIALALSGLGGLGAILRGALLALGH